MHVDEIMAQIYAENPKWFPYGLSRDMLTSAWKVIDPVTKKAAGFTGWQVRPNDKGGRTGWYAIGLLPEYRGQGLAKRALQELFSKHKPDGIEDIKAFIVDGNTPSVRLAEKLGIPYQHKAARAGLHHSRLPITLAGMTKAASIRAPMVNLQQYMPIVRRRNQLTPQEQAAIEANQRNWFPAMFTSGADSPAVDMHSPAKAALMAALAGGGAGYLGAGLANASPSTRTMITAGGATLPALLAYLSTRAKNDDVVETMRRIPANGTRRDVESDPVYQARLNREAQSGASTEALRTAQMLAALQAVKHANVGKLLGGLLSKMKQTVRSNWAPTAKYVAAPALGSYAWDQALYHDQPGEHIPVRALMGLVNTAALGLAARSKKPVKNLATAIVGIPGKDLLIQGNLTLPKVVKSVEQMAANSKEVPSSTTVNAGENWLQTLGNSVKENPWTAAGAGTLGIAGLAGLAHLMGGGKAPAIVPPSEQSGRIRVTLPTRRRGDAETTVELPVDQMGMSEGLMRRLQRDVRGRLRAETNERTRKVNLSEEERQRRREMLLARLRPSIL